jgi:hypothetical protein
MDAIEHRIRSAGCAREMKLREEEGGERRPVLAEIDDGSCQHLRAAVERFNGLGAN